MLSDLLKSDSLLVRLSVGVLVVFGPLYILQSYGFKFAYFIAFMVFIGILLRFVGEQRRDFYGNNRIGV